MSDLPNGPTTPTQDSVREWFDALDRAPWLPLDIHYRVDGWTLGVYSALSPVHLRHEVLQTRGWALLRGTHGPGFSQQFDDDGGHSATYHRISSYPLESLVHERNFHGLQPGHIELSEELRLFHNFYADRTEARFLKFDDAGNEDVAARIDDGCVWMRTSLVRQYQAARQLDVLLFIESDMNQASEVPAAATVLEWSDDLSRGEFYWASAGDRHITRVTGTRVLPPPERSTCGIWPFETQDDHFPEFTIGTDEAGRPIRYTCNPDALANNFGLNPHAPHYLTPVCFRRAVLVKYHDRPDLYSVEDGYIRCAGLWSLRVDNDMPDSIVVALGDLGRDLPASERDYWLAFNVQPDGRMSETHIRRAFLAEFADPLSSDLLFRTAYEDLRSVWTTRFGWPLFRDPDDLDAKLLDQVRRPLHDTDKEFEELVDVLAKLMVDLLNEEELVRGLPPGPSDERGISKLERWLESKDVLGFDDTISFLRSVWSARSKGTAHAKGSEYEQTVSRLVGDRRRAEAANELLTRALHAVRWLSSIAGAED